MESIFHINQANEPGLFKLDDIDLKSAVDICKALSQPILYLTDENLSEEALKLLATKTGIDSKKLSDGSVSPEKWDELMQEANELGESLLYIDRKPASIEDLQLIAFEARKNLGVRHLIIQDMAASDKLEAAATETGTLIIIKG